MASKLNNNMNKAIIIHALLGLLVGVIARTYFHALQDNVEENESYLGQHFDELGGTVARSIQDGFVTLAVKFLHFFISKCLQFRYLPALLLAPSAMSLLFWVAFTRSISSMPNNPL
ncbi:Uncharacterized protein TCM_034524 [Theobroma cacao]|uniref:Uncharacterized protein n=1 Tax=Theobroma cacao TaxID=3641 RepID=A0A061FEY4_THECC|nr:Uncharacterized protein TCM_034524 [Theobroma cacao]